MPYVVLVRHVTSTPVDRSGRAALLLHLAATGVVLTAVMALLADLPDGAHGTAPVGSSVAAPDGGGRRNDVAPDHPTISIPAAGPVRVLADVAELDDDPAQHLSEPDRVPHDSQPSGHHHGKAAGAGGSRKHPAVPPGKKGSSRKR
jgi:hypothetical protein